MKAAAVRAICSFSAGYLAIGVLFGGLAGRAASIETRMGWRWAAWGASAFAFGLHILYEQLRLRSSPKATALHAASAVGLGAFLLAAAANVHARVTAQRPSTLLVLSLAIWPVMTALPAFVIALGSAVLTGRVRRRSGRLGGQ
jgi:hypothetical protein